ncbi:LacI family DNA-binding transcriptional regulator [Brevibacillus fulvus]|uniref:LacI family transcriptional regulator n=1 Tax=Brevibacillus fulvus TaxID=1125967 RepID=A0A939BNL0_9BACL|nr:LacI family DNA-binding transcriptional regulator [Brevibacillus fulvus]MBM7589230.1 LacI family transcriptional regulator [Brevibacillus fulvus]
MSVTIKDIARIAGVSYSTVSKALNDSPLVKKKTKEAILKVAEQLGYQPNMAAKSLVSKKSQIIGVAWPTVERPAWSTLITKINDLLGQQAYHTLLSINPVDSAITIFNRFHVDAILLFQEESRGRPGLPQSTVPILCYGKPEGQLSAVDVNRRKAMFAAVRYLYERNHRRLAYIGDLSPNDLIQQEKYIGFAEAIIQFGLPTHPLMTMNTAGNSADQGYRLTKQLLHSAYEPTAIVSGSYDITVGVMRALKEEGVIVPADLSLISYDNIPQMASFDVPITAVGAPIERIAAGIVDSLFAIINKTKLSPFCKQIEIELVERASCQPL